MVIRLCLFAISSRFPPSSRTSLLFTRSKPEPRTVDFYLFLHLPSRFGFHPVPRVRFHKDPDGFMGYIDRVRDLTRHVGHQSLNEAEVAISSVAGFGKCWPMQGDLYKSILCT